MYEAKHLIAMLTYIFILILQTHLWVCDIAKLLFFTTILTTTCGFSSRKFISWKFKNYLTYVLYLEDKLFLRYSDRCVARNVKKYEHKLLSLSLLCLGFASNQIECDILKEVLDIIDISSVLQHFLHISLVYKRYKFLLSTTQIVWYNQYY